MQLTLLLRILEQYPDLLAVLTIGQIVHFIAICRHLKPRIALLPSDDGGPPESLPRSVHEFNCAVLSAASDVVKLCWSALKHHIWGLDYCEANAAEYLPLFLKHGLACGIGYRDLLPPVVCCINDDCRVVDSLSGEITGRKLGKEYIHRAVLFSHDLGSLPVWTSSFFCANCHTRYYHNYYVQNKTGEPARRQYYEMADMPSVIQIADHFFVTKELCVWVTNQMVCGWVSGSNNARIYNETHPAPECDWSVSLELSYQHVWDAFFLHGLLLHHLEYGTRLDLPDNVPSSVDRLQDALRARNQLVAGPGQQDWNHACTLCCKLFTRQDGSIGYLRSFVTDGITMGHPACAVHNCEMPLSSNRDRFCKTHKDQELFCSARLNGAPCTNLRQSGRRTCAIPEHQALEERYTLRGQAMFQLKQRLEKLSLSQTHSSVDNNRPEEEGTGGDSDEEVIGDDLCPDKPENGNRKLRAKFGRNRTHNEELCVGSCGVIIGRKTMFGSEAATGVIKFWKLLFPTKASLPQCLWHDNNCTIAKYLAAHNDTYFDDVALPVDVFHFKCKHKERDEFCGLNCNPARWKDLQVDGKWAFNSSAAEQANVWMGGFRAIVREMRPDRYNFFLDEMIKQRNRLIITQLERKGCGPWSIPHEVLLKK